MDRLSSRFLGIPRPANVPVCQVPIFWLILTRCFGGQCGNEDARYEGYRTCALCCYFGTVVIALYDVILSVAMYLYILPISYIGTFVVDMVLALLSLIFVWGWIILSRQGGNPYHEIVNFGLIEGYWGPNTHAIKLGRGRGVNYAASMMRYEEVLSKKNNMPIGKALCSSRLCYHPAEAIVSDDMSMTFYTYGDATNTNLTAQDVAYYREAHA